LHLLLERWAEIILIACYAIISLDRENLRYQTMNEHGRLYNPILRSL